LVKALPLSGKEVRRPLPLAGEGSVLKKALALGRGNDAYGRRILPLPKGEDA
jgi:hypothetical protein